MDTTQAAATEVASSKNAHTRRLQDKMGICPYFGTEEILDEILIQKETYGGKHFPKNIFKMSAEGNILYTQFLKSKGAVSDMPSDYYQGLLSEFLSAPKPELIERHRHHLALKRLVAVRRAFMDERKGMEMRIRMSAKALDVLHPIGESNRVKQLEKFRKENEPLLEELQGEYSWQNLINYGTAQMAYIQKSILEKEIEKLLENYDIWTKFGQFIPGFGVSTCSLLIAKLDDPRRFPDSGKVRAFAGVAPIGGKPMRQEKGKVGSYSPDLKDLLLKIFPDSFMKVSAKDPQATYARFFQECRQKQLKKAIEATEAEIREHFRKRGITVLSVENLGWKEEEGKKTFLGYKVEKANKEKVYHLNPSHVLQRAMREFGSMFVSDFYHAWLYLLGENPDVSGNPRIMEIFKLAGVQLR